MFFSKCFELHLDCFRFTVYLVFSCLNSTVFRKFDFLSCGFGVLGSRFLFIYVWFFLKVFLA